MYDTGRAARRAGREDDRRRGDVRRACRRRSRASRSRSATRPREQGLPPVRAGHRGGHGGRARRRLLRAGREPREPAHRDRAAGRDLRVRRAARRAGRRCRRSRGRRSGTRDLRSIGPVEVFALLGDRTLGRGPSVACAPCRTPTASACSRCTRTPTTKRRRVPARPPSTRPKACATCSCAAPAARRATSSTRRSTRPRSRANLYEVRMAELAGERRRARLRVAAPARLPRQRDARHRDERAARQLRQRAARRSGRAVRAHHPRRAPAGDHHLPRRAELLPAPRSHPGARDLGSGVRRGRRSRRVSRRRRPVAAVEALLRVVVDRAGEGAAPGVPRPRRGERVHVVVRARLRHRPQGRVHDAHRRRRLPAQAARVAARAPHAGRPRRVTGCACPTT